MIAHISISQLTLSNFFYDVEREPFPGVRARIAKQRQQEQRLRSRDEEFASSYDPNSNNNAAGKDAVGISAPMVSGSNACIMY